MFETYPFGYSIIFCEELAPGELLVRLGARRESVFPLTREQARVGAPGALRVPPYRFFLRQML
ncbi:hypothetical protein [Streptomyces vastus]|uniref:Uncharacterized protein n=1 Tax=Streptomyces vastus TaxID=285451 RepID=A0ABN3RNU4_9ACTN